MRTRGVILGLLLAAVASACLWDMDTLSVEARGMPTVVDAIVGRFERNPPLYYEMRLERVESEIARLANVPDLYDDAAVACDRLGRGDEALDWMEKKRTILDALDPQHKRHEDWYRYYANVGTVRVHRWARNGMKSTEMDELKQSIGEIEKAIEINPDAHFGREFVQLAMMKAILIYRRDGALAAHEFVRQTLASRDNEMVAEGLVGLIHLGNAWESVDVFTKLSDRATIRGSQSIRVLAARRADELVKSGKTSVFGEDRVLVMLGDPSLNTGGQTTKELEGAYKALRMNADEYHRNRTEFMMARLRSGRHPDTDPNFWDGYIETERVNLRQFEPFIPRKWLLSRNTWVVLTIVVVSSPFVALYIFRRRKEKAKLPPAA